MGLHRMTKWGEPEAWAESWTGNDGKKKTSEYYKQYRHCEDCNKIQEREI